MEYREILSKNYKRESKVELVEMLLLGCSANDTVKHYYDKLYHNNVWNILASHVGSLKVSEYISPMSVRKIIHRLNSSEIFRIIYVSDFDLSMKLYMYSLPNCGTVDVGLHKNFIKENIYDTEYYLSGSFCCVDPDLRHPNNKISKLLFNNNYIYML